MSLVVGEAPSKMVNAPLVLVSGPSGLKPRSVKPSNLAAGPEQQPTLEHVMVVLVRAREHLQNSVCVNLMHALGFRIGVSGPLVRSLVVLESFQDLELALDSSILTVLALLITSLLVKRKHAHGQVVAGTMQTVIQTTDGIPTPTVTQIVDGDQAPTQTAGATVRS